ncbi:MAG: biotin transporter BioY [Chloroflexota bacterium]
MSLATERLNRLPAAERGITIGDFLVPIAVGERLSTRARHIGLVVTGAVLIALTANVQLVLAGQAVVLPGDIRVTLPTSPVPITAQTFAVLLVGGALGFRRGVLAVALYLMLGLLLPVYAGSNSGLDTYIGLEEGRWFLGATGGYLLGFLLAGAVVGRLAELGWDRHVGGAVVAMVVGNLAIYILGIPWLMAATGFDLPAAIDKGLAPFVFGDLLKLALAGIAFPVAWWVVGRRTGER